MQNLLIIDTYPTENDLKKMERLLDESKFRANSAAIFLIDYGVFWLLDEFWDHLVKEDILFYAHAHDADKYTIPFKEEVIFSGMPALKQLMSTVPNVYHFEDDTFFSEAS